MQCKNDEKLKDDALSNYSFYRGPSTGPKPELRKIRDEFNQAKIKFSKEDLHSALIKHFETVCVVRPACTRWAITSEYLNLLHPIEDLIPLFEIPSSESIEKIRKLLRELAELHIDPCMPELAKNIDISHFLKVADDLEQYAEKATQNQSLGNML